MSLGVLLPLQADWGPMAFLFLLLLGRVSSLLVVCDTDPGERSWSSPLTVGFCALSCFHPLLWRYPPSTPQHPRQAGECIAVFRLNKW